jgi:hypothetical protein
MREENQEEKQDRMKNEARKSKKQAHEAAGFFLDLNLISWGSETDLAKLWERYGPAVQEKDRSEKLLQWLIFEVAVGAFQLIIGDTELEGEVYRMVWN